MKMKKVFGMLLIIVALFLYACGERNTKNEKAISGDNAKNLQQNKIAILKGNEVVFTNKKQLITQLENELIAAKKPNVKITDIAIDYSKAGDNIKIDVIQLIGSNEDATVQISYVLKKENNAFYIVASNTVLVCEGCRSGCSPRRKTNGDGYCTKCDYQATKCTKTETLPAITR